VDGFELGMVEMDGMLDTLGWLDTEGIVEGDVEGRVDGSAEGVVVGSRVPTIMKRTPVSQKSSPRESQTRYPQLSSPKNPSLGV